MDSDEDDAPRTTQVDSNPDESDGEATDSQTYVHDDEDEEPAAPEREQDKGSDDYESDFIVEDDEGAIGVELAQAEMPIHLTSHANRKLSYYFEVEVGWMIHNKINPAFDRRNALYELAHQKLDDEILGRAQSTYTSAAWTPAFVIALKSRPDLKQEDLGSAFFEGGGKCEACNKSGHPPRWRVVLCGRKYNKHTLERISVKKPSQDDSDPDSSSNSDSSIDEDPDDDDNPVNQEQFLLGRFCHAKAEMAHTLQHWRFHLNETVLQYLQDNGYLHPEIIVRREKRSQKKREKEAIKIVDAMTDSGQLKEMYKIFKGSLDAARAEKVSGTFQSSPACYDE